MNDYELHAEPREPHQGFRWRAETMSGRLIAKGWLRPDGSVEHTHGATRDRWPDGLAAELDEEAAALVVLATGSGTDDVDGEPLADGD